MVKIFTWLISRNKTFFCPNAGVSEGSILSPRLFLPYINNLLDDFTCNIAIYADDSIFYSKCDQAFNPWQQLEMTAESDLPDNVDWGSSI